MADSVNPKQYQRDNQLRQALPYSITISWLTVPSVIQSQNLCRVIKQKSIGVEVVCKNLIGIHDPEIRRPLDLRFSTIKGRSPDRSGLQHADHSVI